MRSALLPLAAVLLTACATVPAPPPVRADGLARLGEATRVGRLVVTPRAVIEDSRCPINARCVWAGRVVLSTLLVGPGWAETRNLTLGERSAVRGTSVALTSVEPGKLAGAQAPASPLLFGFEGGR